MSAPTMLRGYCLEHNLTYAELAEMLGLVAQTVAQWGAGISRPNLLAQHILQEVTGISLDAWLTADERRQVRAARERRDAHLLSSHLR